MILDLLKKRQELLPEGTDAFRVIDGEGALFSHLFVDRLSNKWLISTRDRNIPSEIIQELKNTGEDVYHKRLDRDTKEAPKLICGKGNEKQFIIREQGISFLLDMNVGYSQGLFLDQRDNRRQVRELCRPGDKVLNTFAYTGAFSVYAALAGAVTTTLDLAQPCLDWAKENMKLNGLTPDSQFFCKGDTLHWLERFARQGKSFNGIIMDPPTFSRDKKGRIWRVESDFGHLASLAYDCLIEGGWMLCTTNCRKMSLSEFKLRIAKSLPNSVRYETSKMPFDFSGEQYLKVLWVFA